MEHETDTVEFWDQTWDTMSHTFGGHDQTLADFAADLSPGRALDLGCGSGANAVWLAERGWRVTALDFSGVAIEQAKIHAADRRVEVNFVVSDATAYEPDGQFDLITSFYIQLWPQQRARMLASAAEALAPGGRLLFVSHDKSAPPSGWSRKDLESLTTPDEVVAELPGLSIERAEVVEDAGAHSEHMPEPDHSAPHEGDEPHHHSHEEAEPDAHSHGATTIVVAVRDE